MSIEAFLERMRALGIEPKYVLNRAARVAHLAPTIERCNMDDSKQAEFAEELPEGYRLCRWCEGRSGL